MPSPLVANPPLLALANILDLISNLHVPQFCQLRGSTSSLCRVCVCAHHCECVCDVEVEEMELRGGGGHY